MCDLPFVFFSDPELMPVLAGTLVATCFGCEQNRGVVQQELSTDMLLSLLKSCRNGLPTFCSISTLDNPQTNESTESNLAGPESRKGQADIPQRSSNRLNLRTTRAPSGKAGSLGSSTRTLKMRNHKDSKQMKLCEETNSKQNILASETNSNLMLHSRFPVSFIHKAEQFFSAEISSLHEDRE